MLRSHSVLPTYAGSGYHVHVLFIAVCGSRPSADIMQQASFPFSARCLTALTERWGGQGNCTPPLDANPDANASAAAAISYAWRIEPSLGGSSSGGSGLFPLGLSGPIFVLDTAAPAAAGAAGRFRVTLACAYSGAGAAVAAASLAVQVLRPPYAPRPLIASVASSACLRVPPTSQSHPSIPLD